MCLHVGHLPVCFLSSSIFSVQMLCLLIDAFFAVCLLRSWEHGFWVSKTTDPVSKIISRGLSNGAKEARV